MNYFNLKHFLFLLYGPAHRSAQTGLQAGSVAEKAGLRAGPVRSQAGPKPEGAGLVAGPGRALGRASLGTSRPAGRLRPTPRPGRAGRAVTAATAGARTAGKGVRASQSEGEGV